MMPMIHNKLTQDQTKRHNQSLLLKVIYQQGTVSRADIARATGLTRTTASNAVAELLEAGLITELGLGLSAGGKPPTLLQVVDDARLVLAIGLTSFGVRGGLFDLRGRQLHDVAQPLAGRRGQAVVDGLLDVVTQLQARATRPLLGIGVGVPGVLDVRRGIVAQAVNLGWNELPLVEMLHTATNQPVWLANDSQAIALAHFVFANPDRVRDLAVVHVGRGVSAGLVIDGHLYQGGGRSGASEIGHVQVPGNDQPCPCGHYGCLETIASQTALVHQAQALPDGPPDGWQWSTLVAAYHQANPAVRELVTRAAQHLGCAVASLVAILRMPQVILAGPLTDLGPELAEEVQAAMAARVLPSLAAQTNVTSSPLGDDAVLLGVTALVLAQELGIV